MRLATVGCYDDLIAAIRARIDELRLSHKALEDIAGLPEGLAGKWFGPSRVKTMGMQSLWLVLGALGTRLSLEVDAEAVARLERRWANPRRERHRRVGVIRKPISPEMQSHLMREIGRKGGSKPKRFGSAHQSRAGKARWRGVSRRKRQELLRRVGMIGAAKRWGTALRPTMPGK